MINEIEVYKAYIAAKNDQNTTATQVAQRFGLSRGGLYELVRRVENGNASKIRRCTEASRLDCLWEYKYKVRFSAIPKDRKAGTVETLTALVKEMSADGFPVSGISARIKKDRSAVINHLNK